jgi:hypothetical protein
MDGHAITFAIGDAIHDFVKQKFIDAHPDKVWAIWSCPCNVTRTEPMLFSERPTRVCPECGLPVNKHNEPVLKHHRLPYTGALDLVIWLDEYQAFFIIEIKSISGKAFAELKRPQPDHKVQVSLYWDIMHGLGYPLVRQTGILYVNKEYSFKKVYEPFYQTQPQNDLIAPYKADAEAYLIYEKGGALPAKKMCPSVDSPNAKECPVRMECFARHKRGE